MTIFNTLNHSNSQLLQLRFKKSREKIKSHQKMTIKNFTAIVINKNPDYDCLKGYERIRGAWYGKKPDLILTEIIQEIAEKL